MIENSKLGDMGREFEVKGVEKIEIVEEFNDSEDSFVVDMERLSSVPDKDINANPRITLQRTLSRKASSLGGERRSNLSAGSERDMGIIALSPRALQGFSMPEKGSAGSVAATLTEPYNQITITTSNIATTPENKGSVPRRLVSFRRSPNSSWTIDPRRILFFFASLSSIGTMLLIYFTLSLGKLSTDENPLN